VNVDRGRVEVYHEGQWGTVCDDHFSDLAATVVCRELGYFNGTEASNTQPGTGKIWMDDVKCAGSESTLVNCPRSNWGSNNCEHSEDVGVVCSPPDDGQLQLSSRRLEIYHAGQWGTVCNKSFGSAEAMVACRQLGFGNGSVVPASPGRGRIWLDQLACTGSESSLSACSHGGWGSHGCAHADDVGLQCDRSHAKWQLRLAGGTNSSGRLEIFHRGSWGTVCDDLFGSTDASVACRQLGFRSGTVKSDVPGGSGTIWLDDVECGGSEARLGDCRHAGWGAHNCNHGEDVGVTCRHTPGASGSAERRRRARALFAAGVVTCSLLSSLL